MKKFTIEIDLKRETKEGVIIYTLGGCVIYSLISITSDKTQLHDVTGKIADFDKPLRECENKALEYIEQNFILKLKYLR